MHSASSGIEHADGGSTHVQRVETANLVTGRPPRTWHGYPDLMSIHLVHRRNVPPSK